VQGKCLSGVAVDAVEGAEEGAWEARCILLLWLSILVLVPFDLATIDSRYSNHDNQTPAARLVAVATCEKAFNLTRLVHAGAVMSLLLGLTYVAESREGADPWRSV
jgi:tubulin-specific chaperone D